MHLTLVKTSRICTWQYLFQILLLNDNNVLGEHKGREKNIVYGRLFFCALVAADPGFDGHWVMPEIFLLNGTFTMLEMTAFLLKMIFIFMHWFKSTM